MVRETQQLLEFGTKDPAESLPNISDTFVSDISKFPAEALPKWAKDQYEIAKKSLENAKSQSKFKISIESLVVSGSWNHSLFMNSFGAKKMSTSTYACFQIGFSGASDGIADSEWLYRDSTS